MSLKRPDAALTLDGQRLSAAEAALSLLEVELGVGRAHDRFRASFGNLSPFAGVAAGADAAVELGYADDLETVLTGTITDVALRPWGFVVEGLAATLALSRTYVGASYVSQSIGDIVLDVLGKANVASGEVNASQQLSAYHVDERRPAWLHLWDLSVLGGNELSADSSGALNFRPPKSGSPDHAFRYGAELVAWSLSTRDTAGTATSVVPFGAASEQGSDHWHVLLREPDGGAPSDATLVPAALRDRDAAQSFQQAIGEARTRRGTAGEALVGGDATVRAGDVATLDELPGGDGAPLRITAALHRLDGEGGFFTHVRLEGVA